MTYSYLAGDQAAALEAFEDCERALRQHLSISVSPEIRQLYEQILKRHVPGIDQRYQPILVRAQPVPYSLGQTPFVGRARELNVLFQRLAEARTARGCVALLAGESGVGKSRLAQEVIAHERDSQALIFQGRCQELSVQLPFQPILQALRLALPHIPREFCASIPQFWLAELTKLLPELPSVMERELNPSSALAPEQERLRLFEALNQFFLVLAQQSSLLLLYIDDLQWADATSLDYLNFLAPHLAHAPIVVLGTYRSEEVASGKNLIHPVRDALGRELVYRWELPRLSTSEVSDLLLQLNPSANPRLVEHLYQETEGNPFFLISVIQALFEEGVIRAGPDQSWSTEIDDITQTYQELLIPSRVKEVIERRVQGLDRVEHELLQLCSIVGHTIEYPVMQQAWSGTTELLSAALDKLVQRQFLRPREGTRAQFEFTHDKIRQFVYSNLGEPHRQELHGRVGASLERVHAGRLEDFYGILAHHYSLDTAPEQAFEYTLKTLDRARQLYQNEEALRLVERGLQLAHQVGEGDREKSERMRFQLLQRRADICYLAGRLTQQSDDIQELVALGRSLQDISLLAEAYWQQGRLSMVTGQYEQALEEAQKGYQLLSSIDLQSRGSSLASKHLLNLGAIHYYRNDYSQALQCYEKAIQRARESAHVQREASTLNAIALIYARIGNREQALAHHEQALQLFRNLRDRRGECNSLTHLGNVRYGGGRPREALAHYTQAYSISLEIGDRREQANALLNQGNAERQLGSYESALQHYRAAYAIRQELQDRRNQAGLLSCLGIVYHELGSRAEALRYYEDAQKIWDELGNRAGRALILAKIAELRAQERDFEVALALYGEACALYEALSDVTGYAEIEHKMGRVHLAQGDVRLALQTIEHSSELAANIGSVELQIKNHSFRGLVALTTRDCEQALVVSGRAVELLRDEAMLEHPHQIYFNHSQVLETVGRQAEAKDFLAKAVKILRERAQGLHDASLRASYLNDVPLNREILAAWSRLGGENEAL